MTIQHGRRDRLYDEAVGSFEDWDAIRRSSTRRSTSP
jgi:hypothetical protein